MSDTGELRRAPSPRHTSLNATRSKTCSNTYPPKDVSLALGRAISSQSEQLHRFSESPAPCRARISSRDEKWRQEVAPQERAVDAARQLA